VRNHKTRDISMLARFMATDRAFRKARRMNQVAGEG
jgi:hypothetical protein